MSAAKRKDADAVQPDLEIDPQQVATLPPDLINRLYQAVVELDRPRTLALIEQVAEHDPSMASAVKAMAKALDYGRLLKMLKACGNRFEGTP